MVLIEFDFSKTEVSTTNELQEAIAEVRKTIEKNDYSDERASLNLPDDNHSEVLELVERDLDLLVIVGIGGSNLGTIAVQEAITGKLHNLRNIPKILFADTVDPALVSDCLEVTEDYLKQGKKVLVNVVTKSGGTTETIANAQMFTELLKRHSKENNMVFTTNKDSKLWNLGGELGVPTLEIPLMVGGRYSVLSPVGLFPLACIGMNIEELLAGAKEMRDICARDFEENPAAKSAAILYNHMKKGINIHDNFFFSSDLESFGKWYRQLMAESLGKDGKGMTPNVSIGSTDLHSMVQLYLGGPADKFTTFITVDKDRNNLKVPKLDSGFEKLVDIEGKTYNELREAIFQGTTMAYQKRERQYIHISLPEKNERFIGQLLQFKMMEVIYLGKLMGVNAFDQPNVEEYKSETRKFLS